MFGIGCQDESPISAPMNLIRPVEPCGRDLLHPGSDIKKIVETRRRAVTQLCVYHWRSNRKRGYSFASEAERAYRVRPRRFQVRQVVRIVHDASGIRIGISDPHP
jgi:hypothetical protein